MNQDLSKKTDLYWEFLYPQSNEIMRLFWFFTLNRKESFRLLKSLAREVELGGVYENAPSLRDEHLLKRAVAMALSSATHLEPDKATKNMSYFATLSAMERMVFYLVDVCERSVQETSVMLGLTENEVFNMGMKVRITLT